MKFRLFLPIYRRTLHLAVPVILSQIGQIAVNLADNMMVGHVGTTELAAASFTLSIFHVGMLFGMGITMGLTPLVGHAFGEKNFKKVGEWYKNGVLIHLLASVAIVIVMSLVVFFMPLMGQDPDVVEKAKPYYLLQVSSLFPMLFFFSFKQFFEGIGNTKVAMFITLTANAINIVLNYILIFGKLGFPALGLNGAGIATLIARVSMPVLFMLIVFKQKEFRSFFIQAYHEKIHLKSIRRIISIGLPIGFQFVIEVLAFSICAIMMGWISKEALAAHQIAIGLASFTYMVSFGISSATTIRVSHIVGGNNLEQLKHSIHASINMAVLFMASMGTLFVLFRNELSRLFTSDIAVIQISGGLLIIAALFQIFDGIQVVLLGALRGMTDVKIPMFMVVVSYLIIGIPVSYIAAFVFHWGPWGIWTGLLTGLLIASISFRLRMNWLLHQV